jgi:uncharacterized protein involved in exopolysaccharide biosynthesis
VERAKSDQRRAKKDIDNLSENIDNLEKKKNNIVIIKVMQPPTASSHPIKPRVKRNTILAGAVGIFLMLILAFFIESISKYKKREPR